MLLQETKVTRLQLMVYGALQGNGSAAPTQGAPSAANRKLGMPPVAEPAGSGTG